MASLHITRNILSSSSPSYDRGRFSASLHVPTNIKRSSLPQPKMPSMMNIEELIMGDQRSSSNNAQIYTTSKSPAQVDLITTELYAVMEAAADRAEMHEVIGVQRDNWNKLLLNSINAITLTASIAAGLSAAIPVLGAAASPSHLAFKVSSALLYSAATAMLMVMNKIQPSQLAEEQRNATRLFRQLEKKIQTFLALRSPTRADVEDALERVLALDRAYPLSLLPGMLEKFPKTVEPTVWWPQLRRRQQMKKTENSRPTKTNNGWSEGLEDATAGVSRVLKKNDTAEYVKLGRLVLTINSILAVAGPLLTGLAAVGASLIDPVANGQWPILLGVAGGALATVVNTLEHGGQVGMVFELYRNCAGFYRQLEEEIESNLGEEVVGKRENGELFELNVALRLGRSLSNLRRLAEVEKRNGDKTAEYAGKLF